MDGPTIAALASVAVALVAVPGLVGPVYMRVGRLEAEVRAGRERSNEQFREVRERSDEQFREVRERTDEQFAQAQQRSDAQHAEVLGEIRRLTDAFLSHSHAPDGGIIFRVPPASGSTLPE